MERLPNEYSNSDLKLYTRTGIAKDQDLVELTGKYGSLISLAPHNAGLRSNSATRVIATSTQQSIVPQGS